MTGAFFYMLPLQRLTHPEDPKSYATHLAEGYVMGGVPAYITATNDPKKQGRIKCRCDLIDPLADLPNGDDGFIPVISLFTCNAAPGGNVVPLQEGTLVFLIPVMGRPNNWICIGCLYNKIDPPSPEHDINKGLYGFATREGTIEVSDEFNSSKMRYVEATGIARTETKEGSIIEQTKGGARNTLSFDGNVILETPLSSFSQTPNGEISQKNAAGAFSQLLDNGELVLQNANNAALKLQNKEVNLTGPLGGIASNVKDLQKNIFGKLSSTSKLLEQLDGVLKNIPGNPLSHVMGDAQGLLTQIQGTLGKTFDQGLNALQQLNSLDTKQLADAIAPQLDKVLGNDIGNLARKIEGVVNGGFSSDQLLGKLKEVLPKDLHGAIDQAAPLVKGLGYNPDNLIKGLLSRLAPEGMEAIENLVEMGLHKSIGPLQSVINEAHSVLDKFNTLTGKIIDQDTLDALPSVLQDIAKPTGLGITPTFTLGEFDADSFLKDRTTAAMEFIPSGLPVTPELMKDAITTKDLPSLVANIQQSQISTTLATFTKAQPLIQEVPKIQDFLSRLQVGDSLQDAKTKSPLELPDELDLKDSLEQLIKPLTEKLRPLLEQGFHQAQKAIASTPGKSGGGLLKLTEQAAKIYADSTGVGAALEVQKTVSQLLAPGGISKVFAGMGGVGATSPWGGFGFGAAGGGFLSQLPMALKVLQDGKNLVGMFLDPDEGITIANKDNRGITKSYINASGDAISLGAAGLNDAISVSPDGVFIEGIYIKDYLYQFRSAFDELGNLVGRRGEQLDAADDAIARQGEELIRQGAAIVSQQQEIVQLQSISWFRCTRNAWYSADWSLATRQGYYFNVVSGEEAITRMQALFPDELVAGFTMEAIAL
jgi:hypothetical protein